MKDKVIFRLVGSFLQIFALTLLLPTLVSLYYNESFVVTAGFVLSAFSSAVIGYLLYLSGKTEIEQETGIEEAMFATVLGWVLAVMFGSIPFLTHITLVNAIFEAAAGLTTTGISLVLEPSKLPKSLLFWRSFMQWVGGLGILTFFIAIIRESGGVTRRLYSAEAHKTDSGSIRPSLTKSIYDLWRVYGFFTVLFSVIYVLLGMPLFDSILHSFSAISTGGFATTSASFANFSWSIQSVTVLFMFIGGVNFVLLYKFLRSEFSAMIQSSEFKLYSKIFLLVGLLMTIEILMSGQALNRAVLGGAFQSAAVMSSTGYATMSLGVFSTTLQFIIIGVMFFGGSLGSTSGGLKMFRLKALVELLRTRLRAYKLPESAINEVKIDGEIMESSTVRTISILFFVWIAVIFVSTILTLAWDQVSVMGAISGAVSSAGNMGPVYLSGEEMIGLSWMTKIWWVFVMLAGRLEMLPVLAIFNRELFKDSN